ncbi:uncharacterized protein I303_106606 [Kwoniella dejecticola CBS 10117]|uniref:Uncharacterized protein n=1 Tax=Kwoniella dejecticola CBS 10117 TaxID=1296121 RepID=A0A1A5ZU93_9TREE|nr:uncharacterized protein I303_08135 [Kwoniella dejecticola CBS 10117]OBR81365.1 hypothetical protein I303_08135 [Kwoniella dejecticola CBS 10117]
MSLSSSTLSLKFMQRGNAAGRSQPSTPTVNSTPSASTSNSTQVKSEYPHETPVKSTSGSYLSAEASAASRGDKLVIKNEEEWFMPSSYSSSSSDSRNISQRQFQSQDNWTIFESSYVPFLSSSSDRTIEDQAGPSTSIHSELSGSGNGGGGRMIFGGFGKKEKSPQIPSKLNGDDEDMDEDQDEVELDVKAVKRERNEKSVKVKTPTPTPRQKPQSAPRTFQRPAISPPPSSRSSGHTQSSTPKSSSKRPDTQPRPLSVADKMRQTISSRSRKSPSASSTSATSTRSPFSSSTSSPAPTPATTLAQTSHSGHSSTVSPADTGTSGKSKNKKKRNASERERESITPNNNTQHTSTSPLITKKKFKTEPKHISGGVGEGGKTMSLDEREKAMKAQKKKDKKKFKEGSLKA